MTADKALSLPPIFKDHAIRTPPTWTLESRLFDLPGLARADQSSSRSKGRRVGGDTVIVRDPTIPRPEATPRRAYLAQPFVPGIPR